jgi:hypothetical protein
MWVKGALLHFIGDNDSHKNLISVEVFKRLNLLMTPHLYPYTIGWLLQGRDLCVNQKFHFPYTIGWLLQGRDLCVNQKFHFPYNIKPFKDEVLCDIVSLEVCDFILGQPYLWKKHVVYEFRPLNVIITLGRQLYMIPEVASPTIISLISTKQCSKVISHTGKFILFVIHAHSKMKVTATSLSST